MCTRKDYVANIYARNLPTYWGNACCHELNGFCAGKCANAPRRLPLSYAEPHTFADYMRGVHAHGASATDTLCDCDKDAGADESALEGGNLQERNTQRGSGQSHKSDALADSAERDVAAFPWFDRHKRDALSQVCLIQPCNGCVSHACAAAQPIDALQDYYEAMYNYNTPLRSKFNFQNPAEQQRLLVGIPAAAPRCTSVVAVSNPAASAARAPIPYHLTYQDFRYGCRRAASFPLRL